MVRMFPERTLLGQSLLLLDNNDQVDIIYKVLIMAGPNMCLGDTVLTKHCLFPNKNDRGLLDT
jgi:hypothetical protein